MSHRKRLSERAVLGVLIQQGACIPCGLCGNPITADDAMLAEREHILALALGGADCITNMQYSHGVCHLEQTAKDKAQIAKADRQRRHHETGRSSAKAHVQKIESPGFPRNLRQKFGGTVERI